MPDRTRAAPAWTTRHPLEPFRRGWNQGGSGLARALHSSWIRLTRKGSRSRMPPMPRRCCASAGEVLRDIRPAATQIVVPLLRPEMKVEIEVTALKVSDAPC